jgi:hypothetical protein
MRTSLHFGAHGIDDGTASPVLRRVHDARNPEYIDRNYGGVFILWDRLFGTFQDERVEVPCVYEVSLAVVACQSAVSPKRRTQCTPMYGARSAEAPRQQHDP